MALYDRPVRLLMQDMAREFTTEPGATFTRQEALEWFAEHYPKIKPATVVAHLTRLSTNAESRKHYNPKPGQDDVLYQVDRVRFRFYDSEADPAPIHKAEVEIGQSNIPEGEDEEEPVTPSAQNQFAYETDLRNYLVKNMSSLEEGLRLYEEEGIVGIEFPVGGRAIDILAVDRTGALVVIELKVSRGYDRVVGQLLRYVAWIKKNLAESQQRVRGVIVAREISEDLVLACSLVPNVELFEYELSLALRRVAGGSA